MANEEQPKSLKRAVFLDRDGTINEERDYLFRCEEFAFLPGVPEAIKTLRDAGFLIIVVTNQSGVARGYFELADVTRLHAHLQNELAGYATAVDAFYICPHHPQHGVDAYRRDCDCRKGEPGMLLQAAAEHHLDLSASYMVGDKLSDIEAGQRAGCTAILVDTGYGAKVADLPAPAWRCADLAAAARLILNHASSADLRTTAGIQPFSQERTTPMNDTDIQPEEDFAALLEANLSGADRLQKGQTVDAVVVKISGDWVFIDTGRKGEGVLGREEFLADDGTLTIKEGDTIRAFFLGQNNGEARFTTRMGGRGAAGNAQIEEAWRSGIPVEGSVEKEIKGGFEVRLTGNTRSFCPFSQIDLYRGEAAAFVGKRFDFRVTQYAENGRNIVVSRRILQEEEQQRQRELLRESLHEGDVVSGTIRSILPFGAFVNVGGIDGLIPISELAWGRIEDPAEIVTVGQSVQVTVKKLDWEKNKFSFSLREAGNDPWQSVGERFREGTFHVGTVARLTPFGAFVTLESGIDGLIHISKLGAGKRIQHPREVVKEGEQVEVKIEGIDPATRRISLALATVSRAAEEEAKSTAEARQFAQQSEKVSFGSLADKFRTAGSKGRGK